MSSSSTSSSSGSGGVGFPGLLTVVFVTLKLCKVIDWSWWWVISPIWIFFLLYTVIFIIIELIARRRH